MRFWKRPAEAARSFLPWLAVLAALLVFFERTPLEIRIGDLSVDQWVQDHFYDFATKRWLVDADNALGRLFFYNGPKYAIITLAVVSIIAAILPAKFWKTGIVFARLFTDRRTALFLAACLALIPLFCNQFKAHSNIYCPNEGLRYGKHAPYVRLWDGYSQDFKAYQAEHHERGRGFPAGHASGGFALMALAFVPRRRSYKVAGLLLGVFAGWWMGGYQMLKGAHYLNHTLVTWCLAWLGVLLLARLIRPAGWRDDPPA